MGIYRDPDMHVIDVCVRGKGWGLKGPRKLGATWGAVHGNDQDISWSVQQMSGVGEE